MIKSIKLQFTVLLLAVFWMPAQAATTFELDVTGTKVSKIFSLDVNGTLLDVMFDYVDGRVDPITGPVACADVTQFCDWFDNDLSGAGDAADAIESALDLYNSAQSDFADKVIGIFDPTATNPADPGNQIDALIIYDFPNNPNIDFSAITLARLQDGTNVNWYNGETADWNDAVFSEFARFRPASEVPLPPAVLLFASGFGLLGWISRRRKGGCH